MVAKLPGKGKDYGEIISMTGTRTFKVYGVCIWFVLGIGLGVMGGVEEVQGQETTNGEQGTFDASEKMSAPILEPQISPSNEDAESPIEPPAESPTEASAVVQEEQQVPATQSSGAPVEGVEGEGIRIMESPDAVEISGSDDHMREELGVNLYTTPQIESIFKKLDRLGKLPIDEVRRPISDGNYTNRIQIALNFGQTIGEGFLIIQTEDRKEIEEVGRQLLKRAQSLGVGDRVTRHSKRMIELGMTGNWSGLKSSLSAAQGDVEDAMMALRDEEIAHMIALGGWLRGLEIAAKTVQMSYSEDRANILREIDLIDYFNDRLDTLHPGLKQAELIQMLNSELKTIQVILQADASGILYPSDVENIYQRAKQLNDAIVGLNL